MTRFWYGGTLTDWTFSSRDDVDGVNDLVQSLGGAEITFWTQEVGGEQLTDLINASNTAVGSIFSSDGSDGRSVGTIPPFQGPDGIASMWASANGGPRLIIKGQTEQELLNVIAQAGRTDADLRAHIAAPNPHVITLGDLADVEIDSPADGELLAYDGATGTYTLRAVSGLSGVVDLASAQTVTGPKTLESPDDSGTRLIIRANANTQASDLMQAWSNASQGEGGQRQRTTRLNDRGELRVSSARGNSVAVQVSGQPTQTAHVLEQTDTFGVPVSWWEPNGSWRAPNVGLPFTWHQDAVATETGQYRVYNPTNVPLTIRNLVASVGGNTPAGQPIILQLRINGVAAYADANRPTIPAGQRWTGLASSLASNTWPVGGYLTVDVVQPGSTTAGTKLTVQVLAY